MTNTPLNPAAVEIAGRVILRAQGFEPDNSPRADRQHAQNLTAQTVRAYLAAAQPVVTGEQINRAGWTCDGIHEPGSYATCEDCRGACDDLASFYNQMRITPNASGPWTYRPEVKG